MNPDTLMPENISSRAPEKPHRASPSAIGRELARAATGLLNNLLDFVFPPECLVCAGRLAGSEQYYCDPCRDLADDLSFPVCPVCRNEITDVRIGCPACNGRNPVSAVWTCGTFDKFYRPVVHGIKYHGLIPLVSMMADILVSRMNEASRGLADLIVPVPLHWTRRRERGFNQSALLADELSAQLSMPVLRGVLRRVKRTRDQTGLNARERIANMQKAFRVVVPDDVIGKRVLLVDDVMTTGATLNEAANELRIAGCRNVFAAVIAIASYG
jgi:ComF family protein